MENTILIIDDEERITRLVSFLLDRHGFKTITSNDPAEAYEIARKEKVDLIIADVMMPGMNGFELAQKIKDNPSTAHTPLMFLTAKSEITDKFTGYFVGAAEFLTKPFETDELLARVRKVLEIEELEQALQIEGPAEIRRRAAGAAVAEQAAPPPSATEHAFVKIADVLRIYDRVMRTVDEEGRAVIGDEIIDHAFETALEKVARRHPGLERLHVKPDGLNVDEAKRLIKKGDFQEANTAFCELLREFFEAVTHEKDARNGIQICLMDDDEETADFYDLILTEAGFNVTKTPCEENLWEALAKDTPPNLVLLSASMEGCDLPALCRRIHGEEKTAKVPILIVSDWYDAKQVKEAFTAGAADYLVKPFTNTELVGAVVRLLRK